MIQNDKRPEQSSCSESSYDVVIIGAGLAGLSLARHLQLSTDKRVLLLDKRPEIPPSRQKLGESMVQVAGYYFSKVLDMEKHLFHEHFMKYNLRMHWKVAGRSNDCLEHYSQAYIRNYSNIPAFQIDRNVFEAELLRLNCDGIHFNKAFGVSGLNVELSSSGRHCIEFTHQNEHRSIDAEWVIDTTGRGRLLTRQMNSQESNSINHSSSFMWVDGLIDVEQLTDQSSREIRLNKNRRSSGHLPHWLATNHFMGDGFWLWVIPLRGKTSLGVVFDNDTFPNEQVSTAEKLRDWICREFPLFARDLPNRKIVEFSAMKGFSYGCKETISPDKWAMSGESSRFTDPLYSPGCDFIALHNSMIVDAISSGDQRELQRKCWLYEMVMQSLYGSLLPTYATSYNALGDQESFVLKYTWELSVYFTFFVFPFINDLETDTKFIPAYLSRFSRLGTLNAKLQAFISEYHGWKKQNGSPASEPLCHDYTAIESLCKAEEAFYHIGVTVDEAKEVLDDQLLNLKELARFIVAHIYSVVLDDRRVLMNRSFIESIDFTELKVDPHRMRAQYALHCESEHQYAWTLDPNALCGFSHGTSNMETLASKDPIHIAEEIAAR